MATETQLDIFAPRDKAPRATSCDVARLVALLRGRGWVRAADLVKLDAEMDDRWVRAIAEVSKGQILSWPGSPGFRLYAEATNEERDHADAALTSQTERMLSRREDYREQRRLLRLPTDRPQS